MHNIDKKIRVAITHGDINGVGYELMLRTFAEGEILELMTPVIYGSRRAVEYQAKVMQMRAAFHYISDAAEAKDDVVNFVSVVNENCKVEFGKMTDTAASSAEIAVDCAMRDYERGLVDVIVAAPSGNDDVGQVVEYLQTAAAKSSQEGAESGETAEKKDGMVPLRIMRNDYIHVASVLGNEDTDAANASLTDGMVVDCARLFFQYMKRELRVDNPRIAVLALNEAIRSDESSAEIRSIAPAVSQLVNSGMQAFGPYLAKDFFEKGEYIHFDGVLAMTLGQALIPFDSLFDDPGCMYVAGLPLVMALPMHGSCHEMAGQGIMDETAFRKSLYLAIDAFRNRCCYDLPLRNPLQKMYHEKKEDGEKVRFAVKKKFEFEKKTE